MKETKWIVAEYNKDLEQWVTIDSFLFEEFAYNLLEYMNTVYSGIFCVFEEKA